MANLIIKIVLLTGVLADKTIPYPQGLILQGAAAFGSNHTPSPYYQHPDFYNLVSTNSLSILSHFRTYQQTTEYTCGPSALLMAAFYRGKVLKEMEVAAACGTNPYSGTSTEQMVSYLTRTGWNVRSSLKEPKIASLKFLRQQLNKGNPIVVEWIDWGGHWQVVIGYDDMNTHDEADDVLIMADPYDTTDHLQDGYFIVPAERFYQMWFDHDLLPKDHRIMQWIIFDKPTKMN